jgi:hypothetical protein
MRIVLIVSLCLAGLLTLGDRATAQEPEAAGQLAAVEAGSLEASITFGKGPRDDPPPGINLGYGIMLLHGDVLAMLWDNVTIPPSTETQELRAYVDTNWEAATIADLLGHEPGGGGYFSFLYRFSDTPESWGAGHEGPIEVPDGADIEYFSLTVPPFSFREKLQTSPGGQPYTVFMVEPEDGRPAVLRAWARPVRGDVDRNWRTDSLDAVRILQYTAGLLKQLPYPDVGDADANGTIDARDAAVVLQTGAGLLN